MAGTTSEYLLRIIYKRRASYCKGTGSNPSLSRCDCSYLVGLDKFEAEVSPFLAESCVAAKHDALPVVSHKDRFDTL